MLSDKKAQKQQTS